MVPYVFHHVLTRTRASDAMIDVDDAMATAMT